MFMRHGIVMTCACAALSLMATQTARAQPDAWVEVNGNVVFVKANTPMAPKYRCAYAINVTYLDGASYVINAQTDPPSGGTATPAATHSLPKPVSSATLTKWSCQAIG